MTTIGIVGANGQVGVEVTLLLAQMRGVTVAPIVRSERAAAFLRRLGVECRVGSIENPSDALRLLDGCDLVSDFSLPRGLGTEVRRQSDGVAEAITRFAPAGVPNVYMSSLMAYGVGADGREWQNHLFARTRYGAEKRHGERAAQRFGRRSGRPTYTLRLGQVHGDLQGVTRGMRAVVAASPIALDADAISDTVFCVTIALALVGIARGAETPGRYTVLEFPELTWREVYEHYAREAGVAARIINVGASSPSTASRAKAILRRIPAVMLQSVARRREFLTAHVPLSAELEYRLKVSHLRRSAAAEISKGQLHGAYVPQHRSGPIPGERLHSLGALERERGQAVAAVRAILQAKLPRPVR